MSILAHFPIKLQIPKRDRHFRSVKCHNSNKRLVPK